MAAYPPDKVIEELDSVKEQTVINPSLREAALDLYEAPFLFKRGYIYDAGHKMVADQDGEVTESIAARVRGWGRIGYLPDAEALQDEVGKIIAESLTNFWKSKEGDEEIAALQELLRISWQSEKEACRYLQEVKEELSDLRKEISVANDQMRYMIKDQAGHEELSVLRKDAERYRWLRSQQWNSSSLFVIIGPKSNVKLGVDCPSLDRLDEAVDEDMKGKLENEL